LSGASSQVGSAENSARANSLSISSSNGAGTDRGGSSDSAVSVVVASGCWWGHGAVVRKCIAIGSKGALWWGAEGRAKSSIHGRVGEDTSSSVSTGSSESASFRSSLGAGSSSNEVRRAKSSAAEESWIAFCVQSASSSVGESLANSSSAVHLSNAVSSNSAKVIGIRGRSSLASSSLASVNSVGSDSAFISNDSSASSSWGDLGGANLGSIAIVSEWVADGDGGDGWGVGVSSNHSTSSAVGSCESGAVLGKSHGACFDGNLANGGICSSTNASDAISEASADSSSVGKVCSDASLQVHEASSTWSSAAVSSLEASV